MTFHGKPHADEQHAPADAQLSHADARAHDKPAPTHGDDHHHDAGHAHESPPIMLLPLMPLALGAIFAGWYAFDWFGGDMRATFWNHALFVLPGHDSIARAEDVPEFAHWLPLVVILSAIALSYVFYMFKPELPGKVAKALNGIYVFVYRKYMFDELYDRLFVRTSLWLGKVFWRQGDDGTIDRFGPDGVANAAMRIAQRVSLLETGYVYHYAFVMVIGVAAFVTWFCFKG